MAKAKDYVTDCWWLNTWDFMDEYALSLTIGDTPVLEPLRDNDRFLMPAFERAGYSKKALRRLSTCRCYLQVTSLAEISDSYGSSICAWALLGQQPGHSFRKVHCWPGQPKPGRSEWTFWEAALRSTFSLSSARTLPPEYRLGMWFHDTAASWFYDETTQRLLHQSPEGWVAHLLIPSRRAGRRLKFHHSSTPCSPPTTRLVCSVTIQAPSCIFMDGFMASYPVPTGPDLNSSLGEFFKQLPQSAHWACRHLEFAGNFEILR